MRRFMLSVVVALLGTCGSSGYNNALAQSAPPAPGGVAGLELSR